MKRIKVIPVFGTRPDAIKMAPVIRALKSDSRFDTVVCSTGQHREMVAPVLQSFGIKPEYSLDIMKPEQTLCSIASSILTSFEYVLKKEEPDLVLVHGDTSTALSAALCAFYNKTRCGHVEAGLRSGDRNSPFPEEMNRRLIASLCELHFAPTPACVDNLAREGTTKGVYLTGNTEIDAVRMTVAMDYDFDGELARLDYTKRILFVTAHRRENLGAPLEEICRALRQLAEKYDDIQIVYPVHLNPAVKKTVHALLDGVHNIILCEPVGPVVAHKLIEKSYLILTDSGGIQEDAPALGKPVIVLRRETERPEGIEAGVAVLAGTETREIVRQASKLLDDRSAWEQMSRARNPYGYGQAAERISGAILHYFGQGQMIEEYR